MLIYRRTSLLESSAQTQVNTVNCVGVMGKGLAHAFKEREPAMFAAYKRICDQHLLEPGKLWLWRGSPSWVLNFPTKLHWRQPSKLEWIEAGLDKFVSAYESQGITEISFPKLGCGNGNLEWEEVRPLMERYLGKLPIKVYIHDYSAGQFVRRFDHADLQATPTQGHWIYHQAFADGLYRVRVEIEDHLAYDAYIPLGAALF